MGNNHKISDREKNSILRGSKKYNTELKDISKLKANIKIKYVKPKLNGTPRKLLNSSRAINYGWRTKINLNSGFDKLINSYIKEIKNYQ